MIINRVPPVGILCISHNNRIKNEYEQRFRYSKLKVKCMTISSFKLALVRELVFPRKENYSIRTSKYFEEEFITEEFNLTRWINKLEPQISEEFNKKIDTMTKEEVQEFHLELAKSTNKAMTIYCNYAEKEVDNQIIIDEFSAILTKYSIGFEDIDFKSLVKKHFEVSLDVSTKIVPLQFSTYEKAVQLKIMEDPRHCKSIRQNFIVMDKSQDHSLATNYIIEKNVEFNNRSVVLRMYDVNQSIYLFRNKVLTVPVLSDTTFSQTFRFGKNIAYFANWVISIIQYIRDGKQIREPIETDSTFIKHNDEIKDEVVSYSDDWTDKVLQHEDKIPMVILRQNSHLTYIALNLLYETRQSTVRYKFDLPNKEARQSMTTSMNIFVTAMKISFEEYSLNQRTPTVMKDLSMIEDLRKFVIEKEGERELTLTCTAIRTAIKLKDEGNVTYDDYVTIINRARQLFLKELNVRVTF